jgi:MoxR-like ATPase
VDSTVQSPREAEPRPASPAWYLAIAHHPDADRVGLTVPVPVGTELDLGRGAGCFGDGALELETLSRRHAGVAATGAELRIRDLGSRNGTWVNGTRTAEAALAPDDVIELGDVLLVAFRSALPPRRTREPELEAAGGAIAAVVDELRRVAGHATTAFLIGETGTGKTALARALHRWSGRGPLVVLPCAAVGGELAAAELHGVEAGAYPGAVARDGVLAQAEGGTLVLDGVDDAGPILQGAIRAFLDDRMRRPAGGTPRAADVRVVATARALGRVRDELASRVERFVVRVPPLRERVEDVAVLARAAFARRGRVPSKRLALAMLRHGWPRNGGELDSVVERAVIDAGDEDPVPLSPAVGVQLGATPPAAAAALSLAADGSWLRTAGADPISLRRRENLSLLLRALVGARRDRPGSALAVDDLFRAGWPGQRADARSAAGRVYVALTSLRNLGLREVLRRDDAGYLLDPDSPIEIVD